MNPRQMYGELFDKKFKKIKRWFQVDCLRESSKLEQKIKGLFQMLNEIDPNQVFVKSLKYESQVASAHWYRKIGQVLPETYEEMIAFCDEPKGIFRFPSKHKGILGVLKKAEKAIKQVCVGKTWDLILENWCTFNFMLDSIFINEGFTPSMQMGFAERLKKMKGDYIDSFCEKREEQNFFDFKERVVYKIKQKKEFQIKMRNIKLQVPSAIKILLLL